MRSTRTFLPFFYRAFIALVFAAASIGKTVSAGQNAPPSTLFEQWAVSRNLQAVYITFEMFLSVWVISGVQLLPSMVVVVCASMVFSALIGLDLAGPRPVPCGCITNAGASRSYNVVRLSLVGELVLNSMIMLMSLGLIRGERTRVRVAFDPRRCGCVSNRADAEQS